MREPDYKVGDYLSRWHLIPKNRWFNIYLHKITQPDDHAVHDHPWYSLSIILKGSYVEWFHDHSHKERRAGSFIFRHPLLLHRLQPATKEVWSLFLTGPRIREWGFMGDKGWETDWLYLNRPRTEVEPAPVIGFDGMTLLGVNSVIGKEVTSIQDFPALEKLVFTFKNQDLTFDYKSVEVYFNRNDKRLFKMFTTVTNGSFDSLVGGVLKEVKHFSLGTRKGSYYEAKTDTGFVRFQFDGLAE